MEVTQVFRQFEIAVNEARSERKDPSRKHGVGQLFCSLLEIVGNTPKTRSDIQEICGVGRATIDRWRKGTAVPHPGYIERLREYFLLDQRTSLTTHRSLQADLLNPKYRPVIHFLLAEETAGRTLDEGQVGKLLWLVEQSTGTPSAEMMRTFLGLRE
jgi:hypothetical protein